MLKAKFFKKAVLMILTLGCLIGMGLAPKANASTIHATQPTGVILMGKPPYKFTQGKNAWMAWSSHLVKNVEKTLKIKQMKSDLHHWMKHYLDL